MSRNDGEDSDVEVRRQPSSSVLAFFRWSQARRGAKRFTEVVEREVANVERNTASGSFLFEHYRDRAAFDAVAKPDATAAGELCVCKTLKHGQV